MPATVDTVLDVIADELAIDRASLKPSSRLEELDIGSLDMVAAALALETRFGATLEQADMKGLSTLQDLAELVLARSSGGTERGPATGKP